jgi:hypothetical protein
MAELITLTSTSDGIHELHFGMDVNTTASFEIQLWITKYGVRVIDWCQSMGLGYITFIGGDVWVHNDDDQDRCNLFGEKRDCIIGVVSNEQPNRIKLYDSVGVQSDDEWEIYEITIPATLNYPQGMYSKLPKQRFKKRDGIWQAEFLRNMTTSSATPNTRDAVSGEPLRGDSIYMKLKNTSNNQVKLFKVSVNQTLSKI